MGLSVDSKIVGRKRKLKRLSPEIRLIGRADVVQCTQTDVEGTELSTSPHAHVNKVEK